MESTSLWQTRTQASLKKISKQNIWEWSTCFHGAFSLWRRNSKPFCERPSALQHRQPKKDKQNVHVVPLQEKFLRRPWLLSPFQQALTYGQVMLS